MPGGRLTREQRVAEVQRLVDAGELRYREIAQLVGCSPGSVSLWARGMHTPWKCERCHTSLRRRGAKLCGLCEGEGGGAP